MFGHFSMSKLEPPVRQLPICQMFKYLPFWGGARGVGPERQAGTFKGYMPPPALRGDPLSRLARRRLESCSEMRHCRTLHAHIVLSFLEPERVSESTGSLCLPPRHHHYASPRFSPNQVPYWQHEVHFSSPGRSPSPGPASGFPSATPRGVGLQFPSGLLQWSC